ncbi:hypothetical protein CCACVL1_18569 [Corchorus capsularis]|uniref:Actin binding protein n=1 Tax=Corchorus capsularis TaxID=210143 RepID=A0A1R3HKX2_COCAP|nr:hypothetical protein CCACVL1_18569 [Corchorus capsularis]
MMMLKEKRDLRPLLVKFGVAIALSFAGFLYSRLKTRKIKPYLPPPPSSGISERDIKVDSPREDLCEDDVPALNMSSTCKPEDKQASVDNASAGHSPSIRRSGDGFLLSEFNDLVEEYDIYATGAGPSPKKELETPRSDVDTSRAFKSAEKDDYEKEIKHLRNMVKTLRERERNLEVQLLEYYGLKEQAATALELQNRLKINNMEAKLFTLKIESLKSENQKLEGQLADHAKVVAELEAARSRIKLLKKKLKLEAEHNRQQILNLQKRVTKFQEQEQTAANNQDIDLKLQRLKVLEGEAEELRKSNRILQIENSELARKLESTQILANSVLEDPETEALHEMGNCLRQENEELTKQVEQLRADRCADVEELVYLRWVNACLRYELRNYQPPSGKTVARDLSKSLSPKSEEKAKKLILEYAQTEGIGDRMNSIDFDCDQWSSSQTSIGTDNGEPDESLFDTTPATKPANAGKHKFLKKLRRLLKGKESNYQSQASSVCKTDQAEDVDSPFWSSSRGNDLMSIAQSQSDRFTTPSQSSSRPSLDMPRWRSLNVVDHHSRRNSDSSSNGYKRYLLGRDDPSDSSLENEFDQVSESLLKSDLVKFAEVLQVPESGRGKTHKKSASII